MSDLNTYFVDSDGNQIGSGVGILPIPLFKGMTITIHGHAGPFTVADWSFHYGQAGENSGLRIVLDRVEDKGAMKF